MATLIYGEWKVRITNTSGNAEYVGEAQPGTSTSAALWRIKKITYDANGDPTQVDWAGSTKKLDKVWDNHTTYSYG